MPVTRRVLLLVVCAAVALGSSGCADGDDVDGDAVVAAVTELQAEVHELQAEVDRLETRIDELEQAPATTTTTRPPGYTDAIEAKFLQSCVGAGSASTTIPGPAVSDVCECTFDGIREEIPFGEFTAMEESVSAGEPSALIDDIEEISRRCRDELAD